MDGDRDPNATPSTAEAIAERAAELFSAKGFAATSIREIAEAAGVTKPTLYYYFGSKEGLIEHILRSATRALAETLEAGARSGASLTDTLQALALERLTFADSRPALVDLMCRLHQLPPGEASIPDDARSMQQEGLARLTAIFERGMARGELARREAGAVALSFLGALIFHTLHRRRTPPEARPPAEDAARALVDLFLHGARAAPR